MAERHWQTRHCPSGNVRICGPSTTSSPSCNASSHHLLRTRYVDQTVDRPTAGRPRICQYADKTAQRPWLAWHPKHASARVTAAVIRDQEARSRKSATPNVCPLTRRRLRQRQVSLSVLRRFRWSRWSFRALAKHGLSQWMSSPSLTSSTCRSLSTIT